MIFPSRPAGKFPATRRAFLNGASALFAGGVLGSVVGRAQSSDPLGASSTAVASFHDALRQAATEGKVCTALIQGALDACAAQGGGRVTIPAGRFVTGSLLMRSGVWLHLEAGASLLGSGDSADYPVQPVPRYRSLKDAKGFRALIYAEGISSFGLSGEGTIDGQGSLFPVSHSDMDGRPRLLQFVSCRDVSVSGLQLRNSALWMQHYLDCEQVSLRGLRVWNHANRNNDAIDVDGCRYVTISDCITDSGDDGITLKSTGPAPCEHIVITNCVVRSRCNAIKCGTESTGGFLHITVSNCAIAPSLSTEAFNGKPRGLAGIALEVVDGGTLDGVTVNNITIEGTEAPIFIRLGNRARKHHPEAPEPPVGVLRNVLISQIVARGCGANGGSITGQPGYRVERITLRDIRVELAVGGEQADVGKMPPYTPKKYPEVTMWGRLPAHGFFVRHAAAVKFYDVEIEPAEGEPRPMLVLEDVVDSPTLDALVEG